MGLVHISDLTDPNAETLISEASNTFDLYNTFLEQETEGQNSRAPGIHASEVSQCQRKMVYSIWGTPKGRTNVPARMKRIFTMGHQVHDMVQKQLGAMANTTGGHITFHKEVPIDPYSNDVARQWRIFSSCDGVFTYYHRDATNRWSPRMRMGLEIKSMGPDEFEKLTKPKAEHIEQAHIYMACLDLPICWMLYVNKQNMNMTPCSAPWLIRFDQERWQALEQRFAETLQFADGGTLPNQEIGIHCSWCPYITTCAPVGVPHPRTGGRHHKALRK